MVGATTRLLIWLWPLVLLGACRLRNDQVARFADGSTGGAAGADAASGADGGSTCSPNSARVTLTPAGGAPEKRCAAWAARRSFSQAVCSCGDLTVNGVLAAQAFDSSRPDLGAGLGGAAVGADGNQKGADYTVINGSLTVAGTAALSSPNGFTITGDLRLAGAATANGPILISRDAWLLGPVSTLDTAGVGRNLHLGSTGALTAASTVHVDGVTSRDVQALSPPCACDASQILDIGGIVTGALADNDDARVGLTLDALANVTRAVDLTLSCGTFALRAVSGGASIALHIAGRVALMVDGDARLPLGFSLDLAPGAELDWFIRGDFTLSADSMIGAAARAYAVRIYVLSGSAIALPGSDRVAVNLYAPHADVTVDSGGDVYGALFAASVTARARLFSHYDRVVSRADEDCAPPPTASCLSCDQCAARSTCVAGMCAACAADSDCCFPLACQNGQCHALDPN